MWTYKQSTGKPYADGNPVHGRGAMAELERSLIQERVKAGLRNAKLKGQILERPRRIISGDQMARLREQGASFREIAKAVGASTGTVRTRLLAVL